MKRILIADDDPALRSALALLLKTRLGIEAVAEAGTMEAVLAAVRTERPEAVLLDWELPGEPPTGRVAALRAAAPTMKVFVASARPEAAAQARAELADAFIPKTDPPEALLAIFRAARRPA